MKPRPIIFAVSALLLPATGANVTWDANTGTTAAQDGAGNWNTANTNWWNGSSNVQFIGGDNVTFGAASGAAATITVDAGGVTPGNITFSAPGSGSYVFTGGGITGGAVVKNGSNGVQFDNANSFTAITVNAGANSQTDGVNPGKSITLTIPAASGYATWAAANADGDGVANGVEYFMGETGSSFTANPAVVNNQVTWPKDNTVTDASYVVQVSSNLQTWTTAPVGDVNDTGTSVIYSLPGGPGPRFVRLSVTINP
ncbi:MAG: hypothetical protein J0M04_01345 [Verrucomicrobia bacterium]|nr:hypothetical protein [Verrucomicrobiota bacterium]